MDQVKVYLALLKKHHFWPLAVLIVLIGLYAWSTGKKSYDDLFAKNSSELNSAFTAVDGVAKKQDHPNEFSIAEVKLLNSAQTKDVMAAWQLLYDNQMQILTWPKEFEEIGRLKPTAPIRDNLRQIVFNYFHTQFPKLFSIVSIREAVTPGAVVAPAAPDAPAAEPEGDGGGDGPAANGNNDGLPTGLIIWPQADRDRIVSNYKWPRAPGSKQIRYAQEDYWVYQALLKIISETNRGITLHRNAAIKKIEALDIGQAVPPANERAFAVPDATIAPDDGEKPKGPPKGGSILTDEELDNGRYVAADGKPLATPGTESKEYKLMPIRMRLVMDERRIPDLLVACANSPLPVEVQRWQYRPSDARASSKKGSMGAAPRPAAQAPKAPANRAAIGGEALLELTPNDQVIEIRGLIYIFNPPDLGDLMEDAEAAAPEAGAEGAVEQPAEGAEAEPAAGDQPAGETTEPAAPAAAAEGATDAAPEGATEPAAAEPAAAEPATPEPGAEPAAAAEATEEPPASDAPAAGPMG